MTNRVKEFDRHHLLYKDFKYAKSGEICNNLLILFKKNIENKFEDAKKLYGEWEKEFFAKNLFDAKIDDMDNSIFKIYKRFVHSKSLIKLWKLP